MIAERLARLALPLLLAAVAILLTRLFFGVLLAAAADVLPMVLTLSAMACLFFAIMIAHQWIASTSLRNTIIWGGLVAAFVSVHFMRVDHENWETARMWSADVNEAGPSSPSVAAEEIILQRRANGHYYIRAFAGAYAIEFMVDTGATGVALSAQDARNAGVNFERLSFDIPVNTANGLALAAEVSIPALTLHGHRFENVRALVMQNGEQSLLGMSILSRFSSFEMADNQLVLRR